MLYYYNIITGVTYGGKIETHQHGFPTWNSIRVIFQKDNDTRMIPITISYYRPTIIFFLYYVPITIRRRHYNNNNNTVWFYVYFGSDLISALTGLQMQNLPHDDERVSGSGDGCN